MNKLSVSLKNCWGIKSLKYDFDFRGGARKAYSIYAPNGVMKSSFAKTFEALSKGEEPKEERYNRQASCEIKADGNDIDQESIYVFKSEIYSRKDNDAVSNILVEPAYKDEYDKINKDIENKKKSLINALNRISKVPRKDIVEKMTNDTGYDSDSFPDCVSNLLEETPDRAIEKLLYSTIFDPRVLSVIEKPDFLSNARRFNERYDELFNQAGTIYKKGVFNPAKADTVFSAMEKHGFFGAGHRLHLRGERGPVDKAEFENKLKEINAKIDGDEQLKMIREELSRNTQTQALTDLMESLTPSEIDLFLTKIKPENSETFKKELWILYVNECIEAKEYVSAFEKNKQELERIETEAATKGEAWIKIVDLFNNRFVGMPFKPEISNTEKAVIGEEPAKIEFKFEEGKDCADCAIDDPKMRTLSLGEERALNLLYFIFEVEERKRNNQETLFIFDDIADSFDYKNKHAILLYLEDLCKIDYFYQIILTHNFDFYRAFNYRFAPYGRCLMTSINHDSISLIEAQGIRNVFVNMWKNQVLSNETILYATVPFTRNLVEYTRGKENFHYLTLTKLLHWKKDTTNVTVNDYLNIYNEFFGTEYTYNRPEKMVDLLFTQAEEICSNQNQQGLNLGNKVLLSIAIRVKAEQYIIEKLQQANPTISWDRIEEEQFGDLYQRLLGYTPNLIERPTLDKVSVTVSSNIHLNSFMYEPIIDLSIESLVALYNEVENLK